MKHLLFALIFTAGVIIANAYIYKRLLLLLLPNHKRLCLTISLIFLASNIVFLFSMRSNYLNDFAYLVLALMLGVSFFFALVAFAADILRLCFIKVRPVDHNRRRALKFIFNLGVLFVAFGCFLQGVFKAFRTPPLRFVDINAGLGVKIAMISDVHLGKNLHRDFLAALIEQINKSGADIAVIVGDLIDTNIDEIDYLELLNDFKMPVFYVTGNHEYYHNAPKILEKLRRTKLKILENDSIDLGKFVLSGVNDLKGKDYGAPMDLAPIYKQFNEQKYNILLAHQPVIAKKHDLSRFDLVLSGHTHAGQIFPFSILVLLQQGFLHGLYEIGQKTKLYVSSGAGFWGPAIRFLAPSEIAIIRL